MTAPREFWIKFDPEIDRINAVDWSWNLYVHSREPAPDMLNQAEHLHVVERQALDTANAEIERLRKQNDKISACIIERDTLLGEVARLEARLTRAVEVLKRISKARSEYIHRDLRMLAVDALKEIEGEG